MEIHNIRTTPVVIIIDGIPNKYDLYIDNETAFIAIGASGTVSLFQSEPTLINDEYVGDGYIIADIKSDIEIKPIMKQFNTESGVVTIDLFEKFDDAIENWIGKPFYILDDKIAEITIERIEKLSSGIVAYFRNGSHDLVETGYLYIFGFVKSNRSRPNTIYKRFETKDEAMTELLLRDHV